MNTYRRHRFPPDIISYETNRLWCIKFGNRYARRLIRRHCGFGDTFYIDEVFVKIDGQQQFLWRAVDQDGEVVDVYLQARRDGAAAKRLFKRPLQRSGGEPRKIVAIACINPGARAREAAVQIAFPGAAISRRARRSLQPVQSWKTSRQS